MNDSINIIYMEIILLISIHQNDIKIYIWE